MSISSPGKAGELRLEEEEFLEEEEGTKEEAQTEASQTPKGKRTHGRYSRHAIQADVFPGSEPEKPAEEKEVVFPLGPHLVMEVPGEETSFLRCVKCGKQTPLTDASLSETPCSEEDERTEKKKCQVCGRVDKLVPAPMFDHLTKILRKENICGQCFRDWLRILSRSGPPVRGKCGKIPQNSYWFNDLQTFFTEMGGAFPCPACDEFFDDLFSVVEHFSEKHPEKSNTLSEIIIDGAKTVKTWQAVWCPYCLRAFDNERHLTHHLNREHRQQPEFRKASGA